MDSKTISDSSTKKSKKSKAKKSKAHVIENDDFGDLVIAEDVVTTKSSKTTPAASSKPSTSGVTSNKKRKKRDSASSDEERWLTAIESGKLEDVDDELKKIKPKDPALMTARQRAMYDRGSDGTPSAPTLMSLPSGYKEKVMTAEAIQKAAIKSQKRKQLADEKREKDKKKTMERLLKKQETKSNKATKVKTSRTSEPVIVYRQNVLQSTITMPVDMEFPLKLQKITQPPPLKYCSVGCGNLKKYSCSQTGAYLCSLECYKKNISKMII